MKVPACMAVLAFVAAGTVLAADGKSAYLENKCERCHAVASQGIEATMKSERMRGPDLGQLEEERSADWIVRYVNRKETLDGKNHRVPYRGTESDLRAIADWLLEIGKRTERR